MAKGDQRYPVARWIAKQKAAERGYIAPPMPKAKPPAAATPFTRFSNHLDGTDEHRCQTCFIAYAEGEPLCAAGQALYDASH